MGDIRLVPLELTKDEVEILRGWVTRRSTAQGLALRARIVLECGAGRSNTAVAARVGVSRTTVTKWRARFLGRRLDGLCDEPRPGVPRSITDAKVEEVVVRTLEETPEGCTHWSKRDLAKVVGISPTSVHRIWRAFGLQPHRVEEFKISPDPLLIDKIRDVVGLYLAPPAKAAVLCVDEKPQIQALERIAPVLPMIPGVPERRSFDCVRHGTVDLFAALNTATGKVIAAWSARYAAEDFCDFLDMIDHQVEPKLAVHVVCDNLSAHKAPPVHTWLLAHPRFVLHFTPHVLVVDQPDRAVVRRAGAALPAARLLLLARRLQDRPGSVDRRLERHRPPVQVDQDRRPDHRPHLPLLHTHLRTGSLVAA